MLDAQILPMASENEVVRMVVRSPRAEAAASVGPKRKRDFIKGRPRDDAALSWTTLDYSPNPSQVINSSASPSQEK